LTLSLTLLLACGDPNDQDGDGVPVALDCDDADADVGRAGTVYRDLDADGWGDPARWATACVAEGWITRADDCDDDDDSEHPDGAPGCDCGAGDQADVSWYPDADGDGAGVAPAGREACGPAEGWAATDDDCAPDDPDMHPGAEDIWYDGVDSDCAGDDDLDQDGDGHRAQDHGGDDCDDTNADVHPGAPEFCDLDGIDEDCDGLVNDDDPDARDWRTWYQDLDQDGHGTLDDTQIACTPGEGWSSLADDCDDHDPTVSPSEPEVCGDLVDNNCDGGAPECGLHDAVPSSELPGYSGPSGEYQYLGTSVTSVDGDLVAGAMYAQTEGLTLGVVVVLDADMRVLQVITGEGAYGQAGAALESADFNGDGVGDLVVGAANVNLDETYAGAAYLLYGPLSSMSLANADRRLTGSPRDGSVATNLAVIEDQDDDGLPEVLLAGSIAGNSTTGLYGSVVLHDGDTRYDAGVLDAIAVFEGGSANENFGRTASACDVDGDGADDVLIPAAWTLFEGDYTGAVGVFMGPHGGSRQYADADLVVWGAVGDMLGSAECVGDIDGDGVQDVAFGAQDSDRAGTNSGRVALLYGPLDGPLGGPVTDVADAVLDGEPGEQLGLILSGVGDLDGDGLADLVTSSPSHRATSGYQDGALWVYYEPIEGALGASDADGAAIGANREYLGWSYAGVGDVSGNGAGDLLIGAYASQSLGGLGAIYLAAGGPGL
jgi:hypothetical protein